MVQRVLVASAGCIPVVRGAHAIQPNLTADAPSIWVEIKTDDDKFNGIYRCLDDGKAQPVCKKVTVFRP